MIEAVQVLGPSTGGIRVHVATLAAGLRAGGLDAPVLGPPEVLGSLGPQAGVVDVPAGLSVPALLRARRQLRRWRSGADVLHAHGLKAAWTCVGGHPVRPVVVTVHNVVLDGSAALRRRLEREVLRRADRVIAPTTAIAEGLRGVVDPERVRVIVPASPPPAPERRRSDIRARLHVSDDTPVVVCVARLHPQKDLPTLLRAWDTVVAAVPDARLAVVGEGPDRSSLEALSRTLGIDSTVELVGFDAHAVDWIAAADLLAISSVWEAIPLVLAEAMQLGIPVVSTDVGLATDLLGDDAAGTVVPVGDAPSLAAALIRLLSDQELRRRAGRLAAQRSATRFEPGILCGEVAAVYEELLSTRRRRR